MALSILVGPAFADDFTTGLGACAVVATLTTGTDSVSIAAPVLPADSPALVRGVILFVSAPAAIGPTAHLVTFRFLCAPPAGDAWTVLQQAGTDDNLPLGYLMRDANRPAWLASPYMPVSGASTVRFWVDTAGTTATCGVLWFLDTGPVLQSAW